MGEACRHVMLAIIERRGKAEADKSDEGLPLGDGVEERGVALQIIINLLEIII